MEFSWDDHIQEGDVLLRRIPPWHIKNLKGTLHVSSAAFDDERKKFAGLESSMSTYVERRMKEFGREPKDILEGHEGFGLMGFLADVAKKQGLVAILWEHEGDEGHALVLGKKSKPMRRILRSSSRWVIMPPENSIPT